MMTDAKEIKSRVKERYGALAAQVINMESDPALNVDNSWAKLASSCCTPTAVNSAGEQLPQSAACCQPVEADAATLAEALYGNSTVAELPDTVTDISLGCGNPTAIAGLQPGETVLDLGSGGGIDCFLAAKAVGPSGTVIGVDMTDDMLRVANNNKNRLGISNVEFRKGEIENLPVESNSVDVIISNCVINLSPDKTAVFREALRVLKPGGRFAVSDMVTEGDFPPQLQANMAAWAGCITGALDQADYLAKMREVGFAEVAVESRQSYGIENMADLDEESQAMLAAGLDWATVPDDVRLFSARIVANKPY
jgi:arsenite methyltransferase